MNYLDEHKNKINKRNQSELWHNIFQMSITEVIYKTPRFVITQTHPAIYTFQRRNNLNVTPLSTWHVFKICSRNPDIWLLTIDKAHPR